MKQERCVLLCTTKLCKSCNNNHSMLNYICIHNICIHNVYIYIYTQSQFVVRKDPGPIGILTKDLMQDPLDLGLKEHKGGCLSLLAKFGLV